MSTKSIMTPERPASIEVAEADVEVLPKSQVPLDMYVDTCLKAFTAGMSNIYLFAETYVRAIKEYPVEGPKAFQEKFPLFQESDWRKVRWVANHRGQETIMLLSDREASKIMRMSDKERKSYLESPTVTVVDPNSRKPKQIPHGNMTNSQLDQVLDTSNPEEPRVRSPKEQNDYLDKKESSRQQSAKSKKPNKAALPWMPDGAVVVIPRGCKLYKEDIWPMLVSACGGPSEAVRYVLAETNEG